MDLSFFHEESRDKEIVPVLIATHAEKKEINICPYRGKVYDVVLSNGKNLAYIFKRFDSCCGKEIFLKKWMDSQYRPVPDIVEAAKKLYIDHNVREIYRNESAENLDKTTQIVQEIIEKTRIKKEKAICFITGVPGAGKTLAGLNIAVKNQQASGQRYSCFLSGNRPLVSVLKEALAEDECQRTGIRISQAREKVKSFIQIIHHFRDMALTQIDLPPVDRVVIFDEAQRAWHRDKLSRFMKEKKGKILDGLKESKRYEILDMSEPELLIDYMNRHQDWSVIVCLVGGGQDINDGEAGISEWFKALKKSFSNWKVYISDKITDREYIGEKTLEELFSDLQVSVVEALHLSVSLRSFRSEKVSEFVQSLLDNDLNRAKRLYQEISKIYPICMTRNLETAKNWVKERARYRKNRYGLIAGSKARRLRAQGIWVELSCTPEKWFLSGKDNMRIVLCLLTGRQSMSG